MISRRPFLSSLATTVVLALLFASSAVAAPNHRTIQILDNCDPATFNAFLGPGACERPGGGMSVDTFIDQLFKGGAQSWRFSPEQAKVAAGGTVTAINRGGEFHTFTEVAQFGGGCIPDLNLAVGGAAPVAECADPSLFGTTGVPSGASLTTAPLSEGTHRFQCLIHPWQRTTITAH